MSNSSSSVPGGPLAPLALLFFLVATALVAFAAPAAAATYRTHASAHVARADAQPERVMLAAAVPATALGKPVAPSEPKAPKPPKGAPPGTRVDVNLGGKPSSSLVVILALSLLAVAPALLLMCTSFTKMLVVLSLTRNALGLTSVPPNQVLAGLALFLTLFVMSPVLLKVNSEGVQPYLKGEKSQSVAFVDGVAPLRDFMGKHTRNEEIALLVKASGKPDQATRGQLPLTTLIPAFVLSELRAAFIIGFVIFIPFLVIDLVVSSSLMSMGMMMLPPVMISLPFKLLLFLLVDGWGLIVTSLVSSYR